PNALGGREDFGIPFHIPVAPASSISYSRLALTPSTTLRFPLRHRTSIRIRLVSVPAAKTRMASSQDKYRPPQITSWLCTGTAPPYSQIFDPIPRVFAPAPFNRTATRGLTPSF